MYRRRHHQIAQAALITVLDALGAAKVPPYRKTDTSKSVQVQLLNLTKINESIQNFCAKHSTSPLAKSVHGLGASHLEDGFPGSMSLRHHCRLQYTRGLVYPLLRKKRKKRKKHSHSDN